MALEVYVSTHYIDKLEDKEIEANLALGCMYSKAICGVRGCDSLGRVTTMGWLTTRLWHACRCVCGIYGLTLQHTGVQPPIFSSYRRY